MQTSSRLYLCILNQTGDIVLHKNIKAQKNIKANPDALLKAIEPYRSDLVIGVEWMLTWYRVADLCEHKGIDIVFRQNPS